MAVSDDRRICLALTLHSRNPPPSLLMTPSKKASRFCVVAGALGGPRCAGLNPRAFMVQGRRGRRPPHRTCCFDANLVESSHTNGARAVNQLRVNRERGSAPPATPDTPGS